MLSFNNTQLSFMDMTEKVIFITNYPEEILYFIISNDKYTISVRIGLNRGSKMSAFKKQMRTDYNRFHTSCERYFFTILRYLMSICCKFNYRNLLNNNNEIKEDSD